MTQKNAADPAGMFSLPQDWLAAPQELLPSGRIYAQFAETLRSIAQAQIVYGQAVLRANAGLLAALMDQSIPGNANAGSERPSRAARQPDVSAP